MAGMTDPRAAGFNAAKFRDAVRFAMTMGLPNAVEERITFKWDVVRSYDNPDPAGNPYNWHETPTRRVELDPVQVTAAVEFKTDSSDGTPLGSIENPHVIITLLDQDYELVRDADKVTLNEATYIIKYTAPPLGLFDVTVYQMYAEAEDET